MVVTFAEQSELQQAVLAYWETLGMDTEPTPAWRRWVYRLLFGCPFLAPDDQPPDTRPLSPYEELADAQDILPVLDFHLARLVNYPHGVLAGLLWARIKRLSERALEIQYQLRSKEEEVQDDRQAA